MKQHDGKTLEGWLVDKGIKTPAKVIQEFMGKSRAASYNLLNNEEFDLADLALVCKLFDVTPSYFGRDSSVFLTPFNVKDDEKSLDQLSAYYNHLEEFVSRTKNEKAYGDFIEDFYAKVMGCLTQAQSRIAMYDYLGQEKVDITDEAIDVQQRYFLALEKSIKEQENFIEYRRLLVLPRSISKKYQQSFSLALQHASSLMFPETFNHIWRCFNDPVLQKVFRLHIVTIPSRLYSFGVIDQEATFTSYDRYGSKGAGRPDLLFINRVKSGIRNRDAVLLDIYDSEINTLSLESDSPVKKQVTLHQLEGALTNAIEEIVNRQTQIRKERNLHCVKPLDSREVKRLPLKERREWKRKEKEFNIKTDELTQTVIELKDLDRKVLFTRQHKT